MNDCRPARPVPLIAVIGSTATGKTRLAVELAEALDGEVISADSMQVYEGLDLVSAKPTAEECKRVKHHLVSVVPTNGSFDVLAFIRAADACIADISSRGKIPILCGGTFYWIQAVLFESLLPHYAYAPPTTLTWAADYASFLLPRSPADLYAALLRIDPARASEITPGDSRKLRRALETAADASKGKLRHPEYTPPSPPSPTCADATQASSEGAVLGAPQDHDVAYKGSGNDVENKDDDGEGEDHDETGSSLHSRFGGFAYPRLRRNYRPLFLWLSADAAALRRRARGRIAGMLRGGLAANGHRGALAEVADGAAAIAPDGNVGGIDVTKGAAQAIGLKEYFPWLSVALNTATAATGDGDAALSSPASLLAAVASVESSKQRCETLAEAYLAAAAAVDAGQTPAAAAATAAAAAIATATPTDSNAAATTVRDAVLSPTATARALECSLALERATLLYASVQTKGIRARLARALQGPGDLALLPLLHAPQGRSQEGQEQQEREMRGPLDLRRWPVAAVRVDSSSVDAPPASAEAQAVAGGSAAGTGWVGGDARTAKLFETPAEAAAAVAAHQGASADSGTNAGERKGWGPSVYDPAVALARAFLAADDCGQDEEHGQAAKRPRRAPSSSSSSAAAPSEPAGMPLSDAEVHQHTHAALPLLPPLLRRHLLLPRALLPRPLPTAAATSTLSGTGAWICAVCGGRDLLNQMNYDAHCASKAHRANERRAAKKAAATAATEANEATTEGTTK